MLFTDPYHLIGVDIGVNQILAVELAGAGKRYRLKRIEQAKLSNKVMGATTMDDPVIVADTLTTLFRKGKFGTRHVALAVSGFGVTVKHLTIKRVDPAFLHDRILHVAEQYVPYPMASMYMDYRVLGNSAHHPGQMDVLMVAAPKTLVEKKVEAVRMANLSPVVVDVDPLAAANCYIFNNGADRSAILLGMNAESVAITIVDAGVMRFTRHVEMALSANSDSAELVRVFYETINQFRTSEPSKNAEHVRLYGDQPQLATLKNALAKEPDFDVEILNPFQHISIPAKLVTFEHEPLTGSKAAVGVGLALRKGAMP